MIRHHPGHVPHLDLTPKLNRPLSFWQPLDYLRLLYWVFYFPQALRWYVDTYGGGDIPFKPRNFRSVLTTLLENRVHRQLFFQSVLLSVAVPAIAAWLLALTPIQNDWNTMVYGVAYGLFFVLLTILFLFLSTAIGSIVMIALSIAGSVGLEITYGYSDILSSAGTSFIFGLAAGISIGMVTGLSLASQGGVKTYGLAGTAVGAVLALVVGIVSSLDPVLRANTISIRVVSFFIGWLLAYLRVDVYILGILLGIFSPDLSYAVIPTTRLALPGTTRSIQKWLSRDLAAAVDNINELARYTLQSPSIIQAVNLHLRQLPDDQVVYFVGELAKSPFDWELVRLVSATFSPFPWKAPLRTENPVRAAAAGFWLLHDGAPAAASQAFAVVRDYLYGEEMHALATGLGIFEAAQNTAEIAAIEPPDFPNSPSLHAATWRAMQRFCNVISDTKTVTGSVSRTARAFASNRALGELKHILDYVEEVPEAERQLVEAIARQWRNALLDVAKSVGEESIEQPIRNPYVVGDPVEGNLFVGRDDILRQLEELWLMGQQMQSVVLYGHRRMGKTSILRNAAATVGAGLRMVYVNMLRSASASRDSDVLIAMTDEMAETLNVPAPSDSEFEAQPYRAFERYLKRVIGALGENETLILAIDEFEKLEALIAEQKLSADFIAYLRGLVQMSPKLGFAFAGLHTLEEMTADYFNPFFASVIPIRVGFLPLGAVQQLLANPNTEFPLDYRSEALERIYLLTAGQPYLVQLLGFQLVRRYNDQVFEQGRRRGQSFSVEDVEAVVESAEFFQRGRYYFTGVWDQAGRDVPEQQLVLKALAPRAAGLKLADLESATHLEAATLERALKLLLRHDVVEQGEQNYRVIVELFRRWVVRQMI